MMEMSAWTYGASILTFLFPMLLFVAVATTLYVVFTKPSVVPGHGEPAVARPIGFTPVVRLAGRQAMAGYPRAAGSQHAVAPGESQAAGGGAAAGPGDPAARPDSTEGAE
jgi:hypothetical protein